jgi:hypothetical protein
MLASHAQQLERSQWHELVCWSDNDDHDEGGEGDDEAGNDNGDSASSSAARALRRTLRRQRRASIGRHDPFLPRHTPHSLTQRATAAASQFLAPPANEQDKALAAEARRAAAAATPLGRIGFALELVQHSLADMAGSEESSGARAHTFMFFDFTVHQRDRIDPWEPDRRYFHFSVCANHSFFIHTRAIAPNELSDDICFAVLFFPLNPSLLLFA